MDDGTVGAPQIRLTRTTGGIAFLFQQLEPVLVTFLNGGRFRRRIGGRSLFLWNQQGGLFFEKAKERDGSSGIPG